MRKTKTTRTEQPTLTDPYTNDVNKGSFSTSPQTISISPQTGFISTVTGTSCIHQFKVVMMNGQYISYCERCGKIGDTRDVFSDHSNLYFTTGTPNYLTRFPTTTCTTPNVTPITSTTPSITSKIDNSTIGGVSTSLRTDNITF